MSLQGRRGMDDRIVKKMLKGTMLVMVVTVLSTMLGMLVDGIVIGRFLGKTYMSAYGLANPVFNLLVAINGVLAAGIQVLCAKYIGLGEFDRAKQVHTISFLMALVISVTIGALMFFGSDQIAIWLGATGKNAALLPEASGYLRGLAIGVPGLMIAFVICSFMQIDSDQVRVVIGVVVMTSVNIAGDFFVAFVTHGGLFQMGLATSVGYYVAVLVALSHYFRKNNVLTFTFHGLRIRDAIRVLKLGAPSGVVNLFITMRNVVMNRLLLLIATSVAVASLSIQNTLAAATGAISTGLGMAVLLVSGIVAGEEDRASSINLVRLMYRFGLVIGLAEVAVCFFFARPLAGIFAGGDQELLDAATFCVRMYSFGFIGNVMNSMTENYVQGLGRVTFANVIIILDTFFYCTLLAWILGFGFSLPLAYVWASWAIGEFMVMITTYIIAWKKSGHLPHRADDFAFFPKDFGVEPEDSIEFTAYDLQGLIEDGMKIETFCLERGASDPLAKKIHLCIEEMGANIIQYGFNDEKKHSIDIRVVKKEDEFWIRMRDDCKAFDPKSWYSIHKPVDITKNIGIRMVMKMAKDFQYVNTMQLNNLLIKV